MAAPNPSVSDALEFLAARALAENGNVELAYAKEFALAMARAYVSEDPERVAAASAIQRKLKSRFKGEFNIVHFREAIKIYRPQAQSEIPRKPNNSPAAHGYITSERGGIISNVANAITMMSVLPLLYNSFSCLPFLADISPWGTRGNWTDHDDVKAAEWCQRQYLNIDKGTASDAALALAMSRPHFHPVLEYLRAQPWDGKPRIDRWLYRYMGCRDDAYTRAVAAKWLMSAIKRIVDPTTISIRGPFWNQADYTLVFEGPQGKRKSTALRALTPSDWFTDDLGGAEIPHKDVAIALQGKWIIELGELDAWQRVQMTTIKSWLSRREDRFRPVHGRRARDFPRQCVFSGSTNKSEWLNDDTGGRRFWPVESNGKIDVEGIMADRDQLWAEAYARFMAGEKTWLDSDEEALASEQQALRQAVDAWRETIEAWLAVPQRRGETSIRSRVGRIYLDDIPYHCLGVQTKDVNHGVKMRINRVLTLAGWIKKRESRHEAEEDGVQREYWVPMKSV